MIISGEQNSRHITVLERPQSRRTEYFTNTVEDREFSTGCYLFTVSNWGLLFSILSVCRPRPASHAHFRHRQPSGLNSSMMLSWTSRDMRLNCFMIKMWGGTKIIFDDFPQKQRRVNSVKTLMGKIGKTGSKRSVVVGMRRANTSSIMPLNATWRQVLRSYRKTAKNTFDILLN